jgi:type II secretory pathway pseudopilin PulG
MAEIVVVIAVMGVLSAVAVPVYSGLRRASLENAAVQNTRLVNAARTAYALTIPAAYAQWESAADDTARLNLLVGENLLAGDAATYLSMNGGYTLELTGSLRTRTILKLNGVGVAYD